MHVIVSTHGLRESARGRDRGGNGRRDGDEATWAGWR